MSAQLQCVTDIMQSVETNTKDRLSSLIAPPNVKEHDDEDEEVGPGGLKNTLDEMNAKNFALSA